MKRLSLFFLSVTIFSLLLSCEKENQPPTCEITSPKPESTYHQLPLVCAEGVDCLSFVTTVGSLQNVVNW